MLNARRPAGATPRRPRGVSLIETMVGITIGMIVVAGALVVSGRNMAGAHQLFDDIRINQDLRAAADLITRDLRRAAYWGNAINGVLTTATTSTPPSNPYAAMTASGGTQVTYAFSRDTTEDNALGDGEQFGFRLAEGQLQMQQSNGNWQPVNDTGVVTITTLSITPVTTTLPLGHLCPTLCAVGAPNCPSVTVRRFDVLLRGQSTHDSTVMRELRSSVRVRNDQFNGACPA